MDSTTNTSAPIIPKYNINDPLLSHYPYEKRVELLQDLAWKDYLKEMAIARKKYVPSLLHLAYCIVCYDIPNQQLHDDVEDKLFIEWGVAEKPMEEAIFLKFYGTKIPPAWSGWEREGQGE